MDAILRLVSPDAKSKVLIDNGELVSFHKYNEEFVHQKGTPGWRNSDTEMFPIIGPTVLNNYKVSTQKGVSVLDQHGLLRELEYTLLEHTTDSASYQKKYVANTQVNNSKYPDKSEKETVFWTYDFIVIKKYKLSNDCLYIEFEIQSEAGMPFMLGYHPAFQVEGETSYLKLKHQKISLKDVQNEGSHAYACLDVQQISLFKNKNVGVDITTTGFDNFMCWTEVDTMLCIEPITQYPTLETQNYSEQNMSISSGIEVFSVVLTPFQL